MDTQDILIRIMPNGIIVSLPGETEYQYIDPTAEMIELMGHKDD
jgi:hypothetical protein